MSDLWFSNDRYECWEANWPHANYLANYLVNANKFQTGEINGSSQSGSVLVMIREVEKRNGIGSTNQYSVDCLLVSMTRYWSNFVADLNQFKILDRLFLVNSSVIIFTVLNHLDLLIEVKINFDSFHNWEMIKIGVTLLGSGLHKPTGTFHDFVLWNIHRLFDLLGPWIPD